MIGKHYAVLERTGITGPGLLVEINNVNSVQDYRKIQMFLQDLTAVRHVHVARVDRGNVAFAIDLRGNLDDFKRLVSTDRRLEPVISSIQPGGDAARQTVLRYNYRR